MANEKRLTRHAMAYVTAPDRTTARKIARAIVDRRLAACANLWPVESMYRWRGVREESREFVIVFKTRASLLRRLIAEVRRNHPYEVPCIVSYPMGPALRPYVDWIDAETAHR
jgi:periplasmic divalent cation tolerance protein